MKFLLEVLIQLVQYFFFQRITPSRNSLRARRLFVVFLYSMYIWASEQTQSFLLAWTPNIRWGCVGSVRSPNAYWLCSRPRQGHVISSTGYWFTSCSVCWAHAWRWDCGANLTLLLNQRLNRLFSLLDSLIFLVLQKALTCTRFRVENVHIVCL